MKPVNADAPPRCFAHSTSRRPPCLLNSRLTPWCPATGPNSINALPNDSTPCCLRIDIEFIAQYLQLLHAAKLPDILDTSTARVLDKARRLGVLAVEDAEVLRRAVRLYHDLTQILRLCLPGPFDAKTAGTALLRLLARAADVPDFATLDATLIETQAQVRASFVRILGETPLSQPIGANRI